MQSHLCKYSSIGFVQFIDSQPLRKVFESNRTIRQYLQSKSTNVDGSQTNVNGLPRDMMDAYVRSCGSLISNSHPQFSFCFFPCSGLLCGDLFIRRWRSSSR